jgi:hypothetical protein
MKACSGQPPAPVPSGRGFAACAAVVLLLGRPDPIAAQTRAPEPPAAVQAPSPAGARPAPSAMPAPPPPRPTTGCVLALLDPEDGRVLGRVPFNGLERKFEVSFAHPLLGTPVHDEYRVDGDSLVLVAERTEGVREGATTTSFGSASGGSLGGREDGAAGDGETRGTRQLLYRQVPKLLVRTTPQQRARLVLDGDRPLTRYAVAQIELRPVGCALPVAR